jgi:hypothetical protein
MVNGLWYMFNGLGSCFWFMVYGLGLGLGLGL